MLYSSLSTDVQPVTFLYTAVENAGYAHHFQTLDLFHRSASLCHCSVSVVRDSQTVPGCDAAVCSATGAGYPVMVL